MVCKLKDRPGRHSNLWILFKLPTSSLQTVLQTIQSRLIPTSRLSQWPSNTHAVECALSQRSMTSSPISFPTIDTTNNGGRTPFATPCHLMTVSLKWPEVPIAQGKALSGLSIPILATCLTTVATFDVRKGLETQLERPLVWKGRKNQRDVYRPRLYPRS